MKGCLAGAEQPEAFGVFFDRFEGQVLALFVKATRRADSAAEALAAALVAGRL
jgi:hypothetical protein